MAVAKKPAAKKSEPKAAEPEAKPVKKEAPPDTVAVLLGMKDQVHIAAGTADSDIVRTHLNNVESAISSLGDALGQIRSLDRSGPVREP